MVVLVRLLFILNVFLSGTVGHASDYEDIWYGYQKFLTNKNQSEWFFQCGNISKDKFYVNFNYKIVKRRSSLKFFKISDEDEWQSVAAKITATKIVFDQNLPVRVRVSYLKQNEMLLLQAKTTVPHGEETGLFMSVNQFEKYNEIKNELITTSSIFLDLGKACITCGADTQKIKYLVKETARPSKRGKTFIHKKRLEIKRYNSDFFRCRSLKPFN